MYEEAIIVDLQGFPNDLAAPDAAKRLRQVALWGTYLRECFPKGGSKQAPTQLGTIELACDHRSKEHERCLERKCRYTGGNLTGCSRLLKKPVRLLEAEMATW